MLQGSATGTGEELLVTVTGGVRSRLHPLLLQPGLQHVQLLEAQQAAVVDLVDVVLGEVELLNGGEEVASAGDVCAVGGGG